MLTVLIIFAIAGASLITGLLFVFSNCVMQAFAEMPEGEGMRAMQLINRKILNPVFLGLFMGTTVVCVVVVILAGVQRPPGYGFAIAGALCYLAGPFAITATRNVPLNNALDGSPLDTDDGRAMWQRYLRDWTRWNHVRVVIGTGAIILLSVALV